MIIPLSAITIFADPSVNFALQFQPLGDHLNDDHDGDDEPDGPVPPKGGKGKKSSKDDKGDAEKTGEVVSLDQFRKK